MMTRDIERRNMLALLARRASEVSALSSGKGYSLEVDIDGCSFRLSVTDGRVRRGCYTSSAVTALRFLSDLERKLQAYS